MLAMIVFACMSAIFAWIGISISQQLREVGDNLTEQISNAQKAIKDPNWFAVIITEDKKISDNKNIEARINAAEDGMKNCHNKAKELVSEIRIHEKVATIYASCCLIVAGALIARKIRERKKKAG
jgi:hypothetical protein